MIKLTTKIVKTARYLLKAFSREGRWYWLTLGAVIFILVIDVLVLSNRVSNYWLGFSFFSLGLINVTLAYFLMLPFLKIRRKLIEKTRRSEDRLRQSYNDMLQFAYIAAHDLQSPLATIAGFAGLLRERYAQQLDEDGQEYVNFLEIESQSASKKVEGLLRFSRVETQGQEFARVPTQSVVEYVINSLRFPLADSGGHIEVGPLPDVLADESQLGCVFQNLICNAIKYRRPDQAPFVKISATRHLDSATFCVADNGMGIPAGYQEKVFAIFGRLHDSATPGDGIGLAIVKRIVERHGGQVFFESTEGHGSQFYFSIPGLVS